MNQGINYTTTGTRERGVVQSYHDRSLINTLAPLFLNKSKHKVDIAGLKKSVQRSAIKFDGADYEAKFTIGFEVEKNQLSRNAVKEYELFCKFERDGSCGYEAVTHILPLLPAGQWRTKVFDLMHKAEKIIDDRYSQSDRRCGGHITIACDGLTGEELRTAIRKNCGIVLALFRNRLSNHYCGENKRLENITNFTRYQVTLAKGNCLEFRLPSRFESVKQMMRRYELFYEVLNYSIATPNGSHDGLLKKIKPIIVSMYNGNEDDANEVLRLSKLFRAYILKGEVHQDIAQYVRSH
jgi:hypothetical protein